MLAEHRGAIEYDLLTLAGLTLEDVGGRLPWPSLLSFVQHLPLNSAYWREREPETAAWLSGTRTADILADLFDLYCEAHTPENKRPFKYPRPKSKKTAEHRHFGADPIPIQDFDAWYYRKE